MAADRPIVLTGAASGIGRAAAEQLAAKSHVLALVDMNTEMLNEVVARCQKISPADARFHVRRNGPGGCRANLRINPQ